MKIDTILSKQNGHNIFSGSITVSELARIADIDYADPENNKKGYQRKPNEKRFSQIADYLIGRNAFMPPPIIMSFRGKLSQKKLKGGFVEIDIPENTKLWVIDGQHRLGGLKLLAGLHETQETSISSKKYKKYNQYYRSYDVPVLIIESISNEKMNSYAIEAALFATINGEAKKVDIYLATKAANQGGGAPPTGAAAWRSRAAVVVDYLSNESKSSKLYHKLKDPNSVKGKYFCSKKGFMTMLKPIVNDGIYAAAWEKSESEKAKVMKMIEDYWSAWNSVIPFCYDDSTNYALFKNSGLKAVNSCLITMARKLGNDFPTERQFASIIARLGDYVSKSYWHKNSPHGMNRRIGEAQINEEIKKIEAKIASLSNNGSTGKSSKR
jgi:DGQHR domain-containing protein